MVTAIIGSGGKTTLLHELANKYLQEGKSVFATTTTHMLIEADTLLSDDVQLIRTELMNKGYVMAGIKVGEKITGLSPEAYKEICELADEVIIEADGAKHLPLKIPGENEPVIPDNADRIIIVCGMHALGELAKDTVFRLDTAKDTFGIAADQIVTPRTIQTLLNKGYVEPLMNKYPDKEIKIYASHAGSLYEKACASLIEAQMDVELIRKDWFENKPCLFICGAGHVSKSLADIGEMIGMKVRIIDPRAEWANKERFPNAEVITDSFSALEKYLVEDAYYAVITPGHTDDLACVSVIMNSKYRYLGMIGSHKKVEKAITSLSELGFSKEQISTLHAPIGLSIGAQTPAEIAISILAEIIEIKNKHSASSVSEELLNTDKHGMLCIITDKQGSTPRGVGSMMLVTEDEIIDTIGGGPIEHATIEDARTNKTAHIKEYSLNNNEAGELGMACGGRNTVLFLPI